ncbi:hypothetical protein F8O07_07175 [Pseudoclavibacter sp. CFCC 13796]|uniref:hypothetical protein n=1 Tax=Pseudoclavibacter sp. CFCC 13796 TaxID=2615179 RepID=UPI00130124A7|nr:hypothetical protein [Pseudoclavibacter sp. CFCC 13796]KAB1661679.1 hypothetical protein F8O07_07175 [Pseudoclavibacter sp. CFCC 13796]
MSTFDPTQHPRGNQATGHAGQFAAKPQSASEIAIEPGAEVLVGDFALNGVTYPDARVTFSGTEDSGSVVLWNDEGEIADISVNIPGATPAEGCIFVKNWSENAGMLESLESAGIGTRTGRYVETGFVSAPELRLNRAVPTSPIPGSSRAGDTAITYG